MPARLRRPGARAGVRASRRACARESGDTLIEVLIAALLVALIAGGQLTGYARDRAPRRRSSATATRPTALAQQDQARLRGLTITQLSANGTGTGNTSSQTRRSTAPSTRSPRRAQFVSGSTGGAVVHDRPGTTTADEVADHLDVTWGRRQQRGRIR